MSTLCRPKDPAPAAGRFQQLAEWECQRSILQHAKPGVPGPGDEQTLRYGQAVSARAVVHYIVCFDLSHRTGKLAEFHTVNLCEQLTASITFPGSLPLCLANATLLQALSFANNNFSGSIPVTFFAALQNLSYLSVSFNNLSGTLPESLPQAAQLLSVYCSANAFTGRRAQSHASSFHFR